MWIVIGVLDGTYSTPDGKRFENIQVLARVSPLPNENVWQALARQAEQDTYIKELLLYRAKGRWESIIAYELTGARLEPEQQDIQTLEPLLIASSQYDRSRRYGR
jgi:hypothetical protein